MVVIDTSVVFKWFNTKEEYRPQAIGILRKHFLKEQEILIPGLLLYELTNAWVTKTRMGMEEIHTNLTSLEKYSLNIRQIEFEMLKKISEFAKKHQVSVYDATYAILAKERECDLITADVKFADQVRLPFIKKLSSYS